MIKRLSYLLVFCLLLTVAAGCSDSSEAQSGSSDSATEDLPVDVDLTLLSSTMALAQVNSIMTDWENYIGKKIKISGPYFAQYYDVTGNFYHYVMIDACCYGFEFILNGDYAFPGDYPKPEEQIEVTGIFGTYEELGETYFYLLADELSIQ